MKEHGGCTLFGCGTQGSATKPRVRRRPQPLLDRLYLAFWGAIFLVSGWHGLACRDGDALEGIFSLGGLLIGTLLVLSQVLPDVLS
jgi:hypothetical protein